VTCEAHGVAGQPTAGGIAAPDQGKGTREAEVAQWRLHLLVLGLCLGLVVAALALAPVAPGSGHGGDGLSVAGVRLPEVCSFKRATGLPCPGCGLTRSWVSAVHGDLKASLAHHRLGWLVLAYALGQALRHGAWLVFVRARPLVEAVGRPLDRGVVLLGALLLVAWVPTLIDTLAG